MQEPEKQTMGNGMTDGLETALPRGGFETLPEAIIASPQVFDSESEEALELRFSRLAKKHPDVVFEYTRDPALLHQYHLIYEEQFRIVHNANRYSTVEDKHDSRGHVLVARQGNFCVGGARVSIKTPRQPHLLPVEIDGFRLEEHFPYLAQKEMRYGQAGRFCLLPEFRGSELTREMQRHITRKAVALDLDVFFATAPLLNARVYKQNCMAIGFKDVKIYFDIPLPAYPMCEEVKFYLISGTLDSSLKKKVKEQPDFSDYDLVEEA